MEKPFRSGNADIKSYKVEKQQEGMVGRWQDAEADEVI